MVGDQKKVTPTRPSLKSRSCCLVVPWPKFDHMAPSKIMFFVQFHEEIGGFSNKNDGRGL